MADLPPYSVSEYDPNSLASVKGMSGSPSAKLSTPFSKSRETLVDSDTSLAPKTSVLSGTTNVKEWSRLDHLLAVFCINRRPRHTTVVSKSRVHPEHRETNLDRSPWILPVYVLSRERDEDQHLIPREAKCTIDTGNLQGNIVSKAFLVDVLGYSEAEFCKLTKDEEDGGKGITGHPLIPIGTIHLTWYHANSIKVFREMRFLISENPMYDMVIGAHTIRAYGILDVPNLMDGRGRTDEKKLPEMPQYLIDLEQKKITASSAYNATKIEAMKGGNLSSENTKAALKDSKSNFETAKRTFEERLESFCNEKIKDATTKDEVQDFKTLFKVKTTRDLPSTEQPTEKKPEK